MMTTRERAKIFMPFDAMKGLQEALRAKEEKRSRVDRRILSDEEAAALNAALNKLLKGDAVRITYYRSFRDAVKEGRVDTIDYVYRFVVVNNEKIFFDDIYAISEFQD